MPSKTKNETKTAFLKVGEFHDLAGHPVCEQGTPAQAPDLRTIRFREHFLLEETIEGIEALTRSTSPTAQRIIERLKQAQQAINELQLTDLDIDMEQYADSLADLRYITDGAAHCYNIDLDACVNEVHEKNLTRFPKTKKELEDTLAAAEAKGIEVEHKYVEEHGVYVVLIKESGKVFKNVHHKLPELKPILEGGE